jgi:hypothetical protein
MRYDGIGFPVQVVVYYYSSWLVVVYYCSTYFKAVRVGEGG